MTGVQTCALPIWPVVLRIGPSLPRPALGARGVRSGNEEARGPGRFQVMQWEVGGGSRGRERVSPKGRLTHLRRLQKLLTLPSPEGPVAAITMATSTTRDRLASDESGTSGMGLTAKSVPPAPCAAITIATRASRETPGRGPSAGDHHGNKGGAWWAGPGRPGEIGRAHV